jgi:DNA helicase-2/ATP-dependent DNA helicase PcrA
MSQHFYWPGEEPTVAEPQPTTHVEHIVIGPPGCGKTTWLSRQCQIAAAKYTGQGVLVASLTKAAAIEVAGRDTHIPPENIGTLHAHCYRLLDRPVIAETAAGITAWNAWCGNSSWRISNKSVADPENAPPEMGGTGDEGGDELLHAAGVLRHQLLPPDLWPPAIAAFHHRWQTWKDESGYIDFTDLIEQARQRFDQFPNNPDIVLVDEAQDMSKLEIRLVRKLAASTERLIIVGDPDQALYTWRGADPDEVFGADVDGIQILHQSYRVPRAVHAKAVEFIERMPGRMPVAYEARDQPGEVKDRPYTWSDPDPIIEAVLGDLTDHRDVMIIASCRYMLGPLTARLKELGEPFHNPYRPNAGQWNPLRSGQRLLAFLRPEKDVWGDQARMWTWDDVRRWTEPLQSKGVLKRGAKSFIEGKGLRSHQLQTDVSQQEADLGTLLDLFEDEHKAGILNMDVAWWFDHLLHRHRKSQQFPVSVYRRRGGQALIDTPRITVGTIHSVKGGQADVVYLFPDLSAAGYWTGWKTTGEPNRAVFRLMYVGMTRAYTKLVRCAPNGAEAVNW